MKFNFRKIASALASTAILGSTVAVAAAANFPAPFVANGAADVAIVYGNSLDLVAVTDVSTALSTELVGSGGAVTIGEDAYPLFTSSTPLQLNNSINSVKTSVTESSLPTVLGDTEFSGDVDATISFTIHPGSNPRAIFAKEPTSSDDPGIGVLLATTAGSYFYNATATFNKAVNFTSADSEGEEISLFGKQFTIASATDSDTLVLFQSAQTAILSVGGATPTPSTTVTVNGETFTVELTAATDTSATIKVTDSSGNSDLKEINEAASKKILDLEVAVNTADESTATNTLSAEVIVGANKLTMEDGTEVTVGSDADPIDGTKVDFGTTGPLWLGGNVTQITVQVFAPDGSDDFLKSGDEFVDPVYGGFRFTLKGLSVETDSEDREGIAVDASGSDKMTVSFDSWQDKSVSNFVWLNNESSAWGKAYLGDTNDWRIFNSEMAKINESAYAVVGNEDEGYLVKLKSLTNSSGTPIYTNDKVIFENAFDSTQTWEADITAEGTGTIYIGGKSYTVNYYDNTNDNVEDQYVQLNYPDSSGNNMILYPTIETSKGAKFFFYEPTVIDFRNWQGTNSSTDSGTSNLTGLILPDGDGYTTITITGDPLAGPAIRDNWSITAGGALHELNLSSYDVGANLAGVKNVVYVSAGKLTYNITGVQFAGVAAEGGVAADKGKNSTAIVQLMSAGNSTITRPAIAIFEEKDESSVYEAITIETSGAGTSSSGTGVSDVDFTWDGDTDMGTGSTSWGSTGVQLESDDDLYQMMDQFGTLVTTDQSDTDQYTTVVSYPGEQVTALLYVDALGAGSSTTLGDVKVLDDELASSGMSGKNLIVVGGSCVNTAASTLLGGTAGCGTSWTAATGATTGEWIVQTFANPWGATKVATLVAGWEKDDTANAAKYLTTQTVDTTVGKKLKGTTATAATSVTV